LRGPGSQRGIVVFALLAATGEAVVLQSGELALSALAEVFLQGVQGGLEADVPEEIPIALVAGEAFVGVPDLVAAGLVATEHVKAVGGDSRSEGEGLVGLRGRGQGVLLDQCPVDPFPMKDGAEGRSIGAFGQPEAPRQSAEALHILPDAGA